MTKFTPLSWQVFTSPSLPIVADSMAPGETQRIFPPTTSTLIFGQNDAVLVDAYFPPKEVEALIDWIVASGKNLTTIYITHGHADHFFGIAAIQKHFPNAKAVAMPAVIHMMHKQAAPEYSINFWGSRFPGQIPDKIVIPDPLSGNIIELEGQALIAIYAGHSDTDNTTFLFVPSIGLVVAGDVAYNDVHMHLSESNNQTSLEWISSLDKMQSLNPQAVIAGHKRVGREDSPIIIQESQKYIRDFLSLSRSTTTAQELYDQMLALYPNRLNLSALWDSAIAFKGS